MTKQIMGIHYKLNDTEGQLLDSSEGQEPLLFMMESNHIIPALEDSIKDLDVGEKKQVAIEAKDAYGLYDETRVTTAERKQFPEDADIQVGSQFAAGSQENPQLFTVTAIEDDLVHLNGNHPLAGKDLVFDIEITEKRPATEEEIAHGHAHAGGASDH